MMHRFADLDENPGALAEFERAADPTELESLDQFHDDEGLRRIESALVDLHDPAIGEQRERPGLADEFANALAGSATGADHLAGDHPVQRDVPQSVDVPLTARAEPVDRLEAIEPRQSRRGGVLRGRVILW